MVSLSKRCLLLFIFVLSVFSVKHVCAQDAATEGAFSLSPLDKRAHFAVGYAASLTTTLIFEHTFKMSRWGSVLSASALTMAVATAKEKWIDSAYSSNDQKATGLGVLSSALVVFAFKF